MINFSNINDRITQLIDFKANKNQKKFAEMIDFAPQVISNIVSGRKSKPSFDVLNAISSTFVDINNEWLLTGKGEMLKVDNVAVALVPEKGIPLVNATAIGGYGNNVFAFEERDVKEYYVIPKFRHKKVDFMIEVEGSSMYPKYNSGDVVACRIINERNFIQWNKTHVVATRDQGIIIKRIKPSEEPNCLLMVSDNSSYDPFLVPEEEIEGLAIVVGVVRLE